MWEDSKIHPIDHATLSALMKNRIPGVRITNFASHKETDNLIDELSEHACRTNSIKQVTRLGISQYAQGLRVSKENYFTLAKRLNEEFSKIYDQSGFEPVERLISKFKEIGFDADVMHEPGMGSYFAGTGKLRNGTSPIHVDFAAQDSDGWEIAKANVQLAWNLYLRVPENGGELLLWDKQWNSEDDIYQVKDNYYYHDDVVQDAEMLRVKVYPGEVIIINSRNFHAVSQVDDRLAFGSFISVFNNKKLRLWS